MYLLYDKNKSEKIILASYTKDDFLKKVGEYVLGNGYFDLGVNKVMSDEESGLIVINDINFENECDEI